LRGEQHLRVAYHPQYAQPSKNEVEWTVLLLVSCSHASQLSSTSDPCLSKLLA